MLYWFKQYQTLIMSVLAKAALLLVAGTVLYNVAVVRTEAECKVNAATAELKGVRANEEIKQDVRRSSTPDLDKRLYRWVQRDN